MEYSLLRLYPLKLCPYIGRSAALHRQNYVASFVLYGPLGAGICQNVSSWRCHRSLALINIGGAITRTFFKLAECYLWRSSLRRFWG